MKRKKYQRQMKQEEKPTRTIWDKTKWVLGVSASIATIAAFVMRLTASTSLVCEPPINPNDVFTAPFTLTNLTWTNISNLKYKVFFRRIVTTHEDERELGFNFYAFTVPALRPHESIPVTFRDSFTYDFTMFIYADMEIIVTYTLWYWPNSIEDKYRFKSITNPKGETKWYAVSLAEDE